MRPVRPLLVAVLAAAAAAVPAACGGGHEPADERTHGETEGIFVNAGGLLYQVQQSRQLNPFLPDDRAYFQGVPESELRLDEDELWFAVFVRVQNIEEEGEPIRSASAFKILDTQENVYVPVELAEHNAFAYRSELVPPGDILPERNSAAFERPPNGGLLLFKLRRFAYENRPLEFVVEAPGREPEEALVILDV